jgi:hypothetical protein
MTTLAVLDVLLVSAFPLYYIPVSIACLACLAATRVYSSSFRRKARKARIAYGEKHIVGFFHPYWCVS